jgi:hypothetical protein
MLSMTDPHTYEMMIHAGGALRDEIEKNAAMTGKTPENLLSFAPMVMVILARRRAEFTDGIFALHRGDASASITTANNLENFRAGVGMTMHEGISIGDLGGAPLDGLRVRIRVGTPLLAAGAICYGTSGRAETCGFLVWSFLRLLNNLREDLPGAELGVASLRLREFVPVFGPKQANPKVWGCHLPSSLVAE